LDGFNDARGGGPLLGLREWLVVRLNGGNNLHWVGLAKALIPEGLDEKEGIHALGKLIEEYLRFRSENGSTKVFYDYGRWLLRKRCMTVPSGRGAAPVNTSPQSDSIPRQYAVLPGSSSTNRSDELGRFGRRSDISRPAPPQAIDGPLAS